MTDDQFDDMDTDQDDTTTATEDIVKVRKWGESLERDLKEARAKLREQAFQIAGIDTSAGPGKLLFENYKGEPDAEAVRQVATEYGITPATAATDSEADQADAPVDSTARSEVTERVDAVMSGAQPVNVNDPWQKAEDAEKSGDVLASIAAKTALVAKE